MKTIMIQDTVYRKLASLKKNRSFSEVLDELVKESRNARLARLRKYFGIIKGRNAVSMRSMAMKVRNEFKVRSL